METFLVVDASTIRQEKVHERIRVGSRKKRPCVLQEQGWRDGITQMILLPFLSARFVFLFS